MSLPKTARAAVVAEYGKPIEIRELPVPQEAELEPGSLLVRVDVASICGSDVHQWDGMTQALAPAQLPIVLGHEMMGTVVAFGPGPREDSIGQLGGPLTPVQAALFVRKQATILGVQSADIGQFWKALEFVRRTASRYDFEAMLTTRYPLDRINDAIRNMRAFREIKPLVLPWAS
jgi:D-arabinose 1-dehydrogenase-like Zn-dependent alcohol dehydrogenase